MLQAARSGKQNIVEGRSDAAASAEMEIKLYGVAVGSLHELLNDYQDFMVQEVWRFGVQGTLAINGCAGSAPKIMTRHITWLWLPA